MGRGLNGRGATGRALSSVGLREVAVPDKTVPSDLVVVSDLGDVLIREDERTFLVSAADGCNCGEKLVCAHRRKAWQALNQRGQGRVAWNRSPLTAPPSDAHPCPRLATVIIQSASEISEPGRSELIREGFVIARESPKDDFNAAIPAHQRVILNLGCPEVPEGVLPINRCDAVVRTRDKLTLLEALGDLASTYWRPGRDGNLPAAPAVVCHFSGKKKERYATLLTDPRALTPEAIHEKYPTAELVIEALLDREDFRVYLLGDEVLDVTAIQAPEDQEDTVRTSAPASAKGQRAFEAVEQIPRGVIPMARAARSRVGLDFCAVDLSLDKTTHRLVVRDVHSSPKFLPGNASSLWRTIQRSVKLAIEQQQAEANRAKTAKN